MEDTQETTPDGRTVFVLNEHGEACGSFGIVKDCWTLGSYSSGFAYFIEVDSLETANEDGDRGRVRLPVQSVGKIGGRFFFAPDFRFVAFPGADRVQPIDAPLELHTKSVGGGYRGGLYFRGHAVRESPTQPTREAVVAFLALWAGRQEPGRFTFPAEIIETMKVAIDAEASGELDAALSDGEQSPGDDAMDAAFDTMR